MPNKVRVQFDFTPEALERVDVIQEKIGVSTRAEVIRNALKVYEWFVGLSPEQIIEIQELTGEMIYRIPVKTLVS